MFLQIMGMKDGIFAPVHRNLSTRDSHNWDPKMLEKAIRIANRHPKGAVFDIGPSPRGAMTRNLLYWKG